ncbi:MAG: pyrroline-5-carboxylate reductase [Casimicrobiaceae bacterium]
MSSNLSGLSLGFLGTGTITSAIVTGLCTDGYLCCPIVLSPRSEGISRHLAAMFAQVHVASSNQAMVDGSDVVVLAVRPQVAAEVLQSLTFRENHQVVSLIATFSQDRIANLVSPATEITCAVPLPLVAFHCGPTAIYPAGGAAASIFERLGMVVEASSEAELQALWASTSVMATYFRLQESLVAWLVANGIDAAAARGYMAMLFDGLGRVPQTTDLPFGKLAEEFATKGGLNEQCATQLTQAGVFDACREALDGVLARIRTGSK